MFTEDVQTKFWYFPNKNRHGPLLSLINNAQHIVQCAAYKLSDPDLIKSFLSAGKRGVKVEVLYECNVYKHSRQVDQRVLFDELRNVENITLYPHSKENRYDQVHHKLLIVDGKKAVIGTCNFDEESFFLGTPDDVRNFALETNDPAIIEELIQVFEADIKNKSAQYNHPSLVWGPHTQRMKILNLIDFAQRSLHIYQQDIQDNGIHDAIISAIKRGIEVKLIMSPYPFDCEKKKDNNIPHQLEIVKEGGKVGLNSVIYIHGKTMLIDRDTDKPKLYLGSTNFYTPSLDENRELGIIVDDKDAIADFIKIFDHDWEKSEISG